jgi:hypothetical protein
VSRYNRQRQQAVSVGRQQAAIARSVRASVRKVSRVRRALHKAKVARAIQRLIIEAGSSGRKSERILFIAR